MSQLQKLLDEKWPLSDEQRTVERHEAVLMRCAFTEGYNAAMREITKEFNFFPGVVRYTKSLLAEANK